MRGYVKRVSQKASKLSHEQLISLLDDMVAENENLYSILESISDISVVEGVRRLFETFGDTFVEPVVFNENCFYVKSRNMYVAFLLGFSHGWHWLGEVSQETAPPVVKKQMTEDVKLRNEMRDMSANLVVFWDEKLWDMELWQAMGMPDGKDWDKSYSWLSAESLDAIDIPKAWQRVSSFTRVAKHYQHSAIFSRELDFWSDDTFLNRRNDKRRMVGMFFANRYHYINKLPYELTSSEIFRGLSIAGLIHGYSRYNAEAMCRFLETHSDVKSVIDPCAGWGERMLACATHHVAYSGIDINVALVDGYDSMIKELNLRNVSFECDAAEDYNFGKADAVITCPPYGSVELYSKDGAENLVPFEFRNWWFKVAKNVSKSGCKYFCITTNQAYKDLFIDGILDTGFHFVSSVEVGRGNASHFNRVKGKNSKKEYEEFLVFERN